MPLKASSSKLDSTPLEDNFDRSNVCGNRVIDLNILCSVFQELCCPKCFAEQLILSEDSCFGLCSNFLLKCPKCDFCKAFASSVKVKNAAEINMRLVYGMRQIGKGSTSAFKLCSTLNLPPLSRTAHVKIEKKLFSVVKDVAENSMKKAASVIAKKDDTSEEAVKCGVSVDGTWQRRGYTSMNGCVAALSIDTGKVLDIEVMSSFCPTCKRINRLPKNIEYETLKMDHVCQCNFEGSSAKMETVGASRIFQRSVEKYNLQYSEYYGDGDSKAFMTVKDTYGENSVTKLECIGHIQKRVGSRLRKLKSTTKGLSGKGKLTDNFIDRLQNYYGIAVRSNSGNLQKMQQNVIAVMFHCASSAKKPMHGQCPLGANSWCYYQRAIAQKLPVKEKYTGLPQTILNIIKPVYLELCTKELLNKCLHGKTQNANECLNGIIWQRVPKDVFVCLRLLKLGAYDAVINFNEGYKGCIKIFTGLHINDPGVFTIKGYETLDANRIYESNRHSLPQSKKRRKILKALRKKKISVCDAKEGEFYKSGNY